MTAIKVVEYVLPGAAFARPPVAGDYYRTKTGGSVLHVQRASRVVATRGGDSYRLQAVRVRLRHLPAGVEPLPWPMPRCRRKTTPPPRQAQPITTRAQRTKAERDRVRALKAADNPDRPVQQVRLDNRSAVRRDWRDPDDLAPNRRTARVVSGYAAYDEVQVLLDAGTLTPTLGRTARRFSKEYEMAVVGVGGGRNLIRESGGVAICQGPNEARLWHMEVYRSTARALRPHMLALLIAVIAQDTTIRAYAARVGRNPREITGEVVGALFFLTDYYRERDDRPDTVPG